MRQIDEDAIDYSKIIIGDNCSAEDIRKAVKKYIDSVPTAYEINGMIEEVNDQIKAEIELMKCYEEGQKVYAYHDGKSDGLFFLKNFIDKGWLPELYRKDEQVDSLGNRD